MLLLSQAFPANLSSVILSDGSYFIQSMLATQLNNLVEDKSLDKNVVIKLTNFVTNSVQNRK